MPVFSRMEYGTVGRDSEIDSEQPEVQNPAVIDKGDHPDYGDYEQQRVKSKMHGSRESQRKGAMAGQRRWRSMAASPPKSGDEHEPQQQTHQCMDVDPEFLCLLRP